jgi:hypothetical protein
MSHYTYKVSTRFEQGIQAWHDLVGDGGGTSRASETKVCERACIIELGGEEQEGEIL